MVSPPLFLTAFVAFLCFSSHLVASNLTRNAGGSGSNLSQILKAHDVLINEKEVVEFEKFMVQFEKSYSSEAETVLRYNTFLKNLDVIEKLNIEDAGKGVTYAINHFADWTDQEWADFQMPPKTKKTERKALPPKIPIDLEGFPTHVDWRNYSGHNHVTEVKYQGPCGSCWAFSTVSAIESLISIKGGKLEDLSNQMVLDCTPNTDKCKGGEPKDALNFVIDNGGITTARDYPYVFVNTQCKLDKPKAGLISNFASAQTEEEMEVFVALSGPVVVAANFATNRNRFYHGGIAEDPNCGTNLTHALVVIGYGPDYWLLKNSYSKLWGENGYMRVRKNVNWCGIITEDALKPF